MLSWGMKTTSMLMCIAFASVSLVVGCRHDEHPETPHAVKHDAETGVKKAGEGVKKAGEKVEKAGEKVEDKMEEKRNEP
jgi:hypothetical protein